MPKRRQEPSSHLENEFLRRRSYRACGECRRRKRKCDGQLPCAACKGHGYPCYYAGSARGSPPPTSSEVDSYRRRSPRELNNHTSGSSKDDAPHGELPTAVCSPVSVLVTTKDQVASSHSAAAQPMLLSRAFNDPNPLRMHSFAWNFGVGGDRRISHASRLDSYISKEESVAFAGVYFQVVHPTFAFLQKDALFEKLESMWSHLQSDPSFEAVLCGVIALGSFFSSLSHEHEQDIFSQCASILDLDNLKSLTPLNLDIMAGWILRTIYLRLTAPPHTSCHASTAAIHIASTLCLHRDIPVETKFGILNGTESSAAERDQNPRHLWVAWSLNVILSIESGLDPTHLSITCQPIPDERNTHSEKLVQLAHILYDSYSKDDTDVDWQEMRTRVKQIKDIGAVSALMSVFQADVCLCLLRKVMHISNNIEPPLADIFVSIIDTAFEKIHSLVEHRLLWWNVATVPFQTVCVCLTINSLPILSLLPGATKILQLEADVFNSPMTKEALSTARHLIQAAQKHDSLKEDYRALALRTDQTGPSMHTESLFQSSDDGYGAWSIGF